MIKVNITKQQVWRFIRRVLVGVIGCLVGAGVFAFALEHEKVVINIFYGFVGLCFMWLAGFAIEQIFSSSKKEEKANVDTST